MDEVDDRPENVELDLALGGVADPYRARPAVARQLADVGLGREMATGDVVERSQTLGVGAGLEKAEDPVEIGHRLGV